MGRLLAIDYGKKRTGIAVANGLATIDTANIFEFLKTYIESNDVERIIVGYPLQSNGEASENMRRVVPFVNRLKKLYTTIPVDYYDERFTSVMAHQVILESGVKKKARRDNKGLVDKISATIILEDYMESQRMKEDFSN